MNILNRFEDNWHGLMSWISILFGNLLYALAINILITPMGMYNGGLLGLAQLIRYGVSATLGDIYPGGDLAGAIYFCMNIPLFYYAYRTTGKQFAFKTLVSIGASSLVMMFIPIPTEPLFPDYLTCCVVAGCIGGIGMGFILRGGGSTGGTDIIAIGLAKTHPNISVGGLNNVVNILVYGLCLVLFNVQIAVYSFIHATIRALFMDRLHAQNIKTQVVIITKEEGIGELLTKHLRRGVTQWEGKGVYTGDKVHIIMTLVSKYEVRRLKSITLEQDPKAFITIAEGESIVGNFKRHMEVGK